MSHGKDFLESFLEVQISGPLYNSSDSVKPRLGVGRDLHFKLSPRVPGKRWS